MTFHFTDIHTVNSKFYFSHVKVTGVDKSRYSRLFRGLLEDTGMVLRDKNNEYTINDLSPCDYTKILEYIIKRDIDFDYEIDEQTRYLVENDILELRKRLARHIYIITNDDNNERYLILAEDSTEAVKIATELGAKSEETRCLNVERLSTYKSIGFKLEKEGNGKEM